LLINEHGDDSFWCQDFHAWELLPYQSIELINESSAENREVWMTHVNHVENESFGSSIVQISEEYW
jgi:hypothetical protein